MPAIMVLDMAEMYEVFESASFVSLLAILSEIQDRKVGLIDSG